MKKYKSNKPKYLTPLDHEFKEFGKEIVGFDIETYGNKNKFILACLKCKTFERTFYSVKDLIKFLNGNNFLRKCIVVATNIGFDFLGCFYNHTPYWNVSERDGHIYSFTWYQNSSDKKPIKFYDTINFFGAGVEKLGSLLDKPKLEHPPNFRLQKDGSYKVCKPKNKEELKLLSTYCMNDADISRSFFDERIIPYINSKECRLKPTIASTSLEIYRKNYLAKTYKISPYSVHEKVFNAYYGGRTETFKRGTYENVNCYDFNSLYPSVMINELPDPNTYREIKSMTSYLVENYHGVTYIEGFQEETYIPLLPVRMDNKLLFPVGIIKGYYTHIELRKAVQNGLKIKKYGKGVIYLKTCKPFEKFVRKIYKERREQQKKGDPLQLMSKIVLNSLYGKFAFNYRFNNQFKPMEKMSPDDLVNNQFVEEINGFVYVKNTGLTDPTTYSIPIWSCYITAYARLLLYEFMQKPNIQENLLYCDTDSLFLMNGTTLPESTKLGKLKLEYNCNKATFVRPKFYNAEKVKIKGIRSIKTKQEFKDFLENPVTFEQRFTKLRTAIRSKSNHKNGVLKPNQIIRVSKKLNLEDEKRKWDKHFDPDGQEDSKPKPLCYNDYVRTSRL